MGGRFVISRWAVIANAAFWAAATVGPAAQPDRDAALRTLAAKGLSKVGDAWCTSNELRLRAAIEALEPREHQVSAAQRRLDQLFQFRDRATADLQAAEDGLKAALERQKTAASGSPQKTAADDEVRQWRAAVAAARQRLGDPRQFGLLPPFKGTTDELVRNRQELAVAIATLRTLVPLLPVEYEALRGDEVVTEALATLGGANRLGPISAYDRDLQRAATLEKTALKAPIPVTREGSCYRVGAVVNNAFPATFSVHERSDPAVIPASLAESLDLMPAANAASITLKPSPGRQLRAKAVTLSSVQIGPWKLKDVEVFVLPPEGEDLGAQLNRDALLSQRIILDTKRLVLAPRP